MKFPYDYIPAIPAFCFGVIVGAEVMRAAARRWLRRHGLGRLVDEEGKTGRCEKEAQA